ncbi:hypothetical protein [Polyangium jinanense]|uniref:Uncharacterized protein n=1 Tax=Polyangium jinanense TaxID=2829994 RepID=A0A9X3X194_9BACT|nr:hypothetical protein [Polyangium jinanense]MDC3952754.1 hypothetical protein [Polyangium jinanense]MDC3980373.1 hypothetical protein [Polyangium jinanense]
MADKNIDQDETQFYGPYASKKIRTRLVGQIPAFDSALNYIADRLDDTTHAVKAAVDAAREKDAARRKGTQDKRPLLKQARRLLGQFSKHLGAHDAGIVDRKVFFVRDGTATGVGNAAHDVLLAVTHITTKLADPKVTVRDAAHWHGQFDSMMKTLSPVVAYAQDVQVDRQSITPEVEAARQAWLNRYLAARSLVEGVLRELGRLEQLSLFFYDLRVPAGTKLTEPPPDEPLASKTSDEDDQDDEA